MHIPIFIEIHAAVHEKKSKMSFPKFVQLNRKSRSQRPDLNKLRTSNPGDPPYQIRMISGHWFMRRRFLKKWPKISQNYP